VYISFSRLASRLLCSPLSSPSPSPSPSPLDFLSSFCFVVRFPLFLFFALPSVEHTYEYVRTYIHMYAHIARSCSTLKKTTHQQRSVCSQHRQHNLGGSWSFNPLSCPFHRPLSCSVKFCRYVTRYVPRGSVARNVPHNRQLNGQLYGPLNGQLTAIGFIIFRATGLQQTGQDQG
jgi:hypothetical protein